MKKTIVSILSITCILNSCGPKHAKTDTQQEAFLSEGKYYPMTSNVVNYIEDSLPKVEWFTLKKIDIPDKYKKPLCYMYHDSIMLIVNNKNPSPYMLTVMDCKTKEIVAEYFEYGNKRRNFSAMSVLQRKNYFNLFNYKKRVVSRLCLDSVIAKRNGYNPQWTSYTSLNNFDFDYTNDSVITWVNPQYVKGFWEDSIPSFVQTNTLGRSLTNYSQNENVTSCAHWRTFAINGAHYMEFWKSFPIINIYSKNFELEKQYRDTKFKDTELLLEDNMVMEKGVALYCFEFGCQTDKYVLVNNFRSSMEFEGYVSLGEDPAFGKFHEIWFFDTNCNLVRRMRCKNLKGQVMGLSYCDESGSLYMNVIDEKNDIAFYRCIFEK